MESLPWIVQYFLTNMGTTLAGIVYWISVENLQPLEAKQHQHQKLALAALLSILLTPIGLWIVSMALRVKKLAPTLKETDE